MAKSTLTIKQALCQVDMRPWSIYSLSQAWGRWGAWWVVQWLSFRGLVEEYETSDGMRYHLTHLGRMWAGYYKRCMQVQS